jgi:tetratricopeptide (TPR) repeat protein
MTDFGLLLKSMNKLPEAEELLQNVLNHAEVNYSPNSAWVGRCLNNLSIVLRSKGELVRAETHQRRVIQIDADQFGKDSMALAPDYTNLGNTLLVST